MSEVKTYSREEFIEMLMKERNKTLEQANEEANNVWKAPPDWDGSLFDTDVGDDYTILSEDTLEGEK